MLVVKVLLYPNGDATASRELARMTIANVGGTSTSGDYAVDMPYPPPMRGSRVGKVLAHARLTESVWVLVQKALASVLP
jgi:hypothetical protein